MVEWTQNIRLDGQQKRKDRSFLSVFALDRWSNGLGIERMNVDVASDQFRLWDAENVDTRFPSQIVLSPAFNTCTIVPSRGDLALAFSHSNGQLYFVETLRAMTTMTTAVPAYVYQFTPPVTLGSYLELFHATGVVAGGGNNVLVGSITAVKSFGLNVVGVVCGGGNGITDPPMPTAVQSQYYCFANSLGGLMTGSGYLGNQSNMGNKNMVRYGQIGDFGGTLHLMEARTNDVGLWTANQALGGLVQRASLPITIGSYLSPLVTDGLTMFAQLPEGIYEFDVTPSIIVSTERAKDKNLTQVLFGQDLYFKNKFSLNKYPQDGSNITSVGYDLEDGLPSDKMGEITAMTSSWRNIFAAVKGATYSHIVSRENTGAWQYYARIPSPGIWVREMFLTDSPDAIDRLWCIFGNANNPGYFLNPMVNPLQAGTYSYVPTGHFTHPIYDGGMAEEMGGFFHSHIIGRALGGSNNITMFYGLDDAAPTTQLGIIATNTGFHTFGSPAGLEGYRIQLKYQLAGATSGTTPVFRSGITHYLKDPTKRDMFDLAIDYRESARAFGMPIEGLIATMDAIRNTKPLISFQYGLIATKYVKVFDIPGDEKVEDDKITGGNREGMVKLRLIEMTA